MAKNNREFWQIIQEGFEKNVPVTPEAINVSLKAGKRTNYVFGDIDDAVLGGFYKTSFKMVRKGRNLEPKYVYATLLDVFKSIGLQSHMDGEKAAQHRDGLWDIYDKVLGGNKDEHSPIFTMFCLGDEEKKYLNFPENYAKTYSKYFKACESLGEVKLGDDGKSHTIICQRENLGNEVITFKKNECGEAKFVLASLIDHFSLAAKEKIAAYNQQVADDNAKAMAYAQENGIQSVQIREALPESVADTIVLLSTVLTLQEINEDGDEVVQIIESIAPFISFSISKDEEKLPNKIIKDFAVELANARVEELNKVLPSGQKYFEKPEDRLYDVRNIFHDYALRCELKKYVEKPKDLQCSFDKKEGMYPFMYLDDKGEKCYYVASDVNFDSKEDALEAIKCEDGNLSLALAGFKYILNKIYDSQKRADRNPNTFYEMAEVLFTNLLIVDNIEGMDADMKEVYRDIFGRELEKCLSAITTNQDIRLEYAKLKAKQGGKPVAQVKPMSAKNMIQDIMAQALQDLKDTHIIASNEFDPEAWDDSAHVVLAPAGKYGMFGRVYVDAKAESAHFGSQVVEAIDKLGQRRYLPQDRNNPDFTVLQNTRNAVKAFLYCEGGFTQPTQQTIQGKIPSRLLRGKSGDLTKNLLHYGYDKTVELETAVGTGNNRRSFTPQDAKGIVAATYGKSQQIVKSKVEDVIGK